MEIVNRRLVQTYAKSNDSRTVADRHPMHWAKNATENASSLFSCSKQMIVEAEAIRMVIDRCGIDELARKYGSCHYSFT